MAHTVDELLDIIKGGKISSMPHRYKEHLLREVQSILYTAVHEAQKNNNAERRKEVHDAINDFYDQYWKHDDQDVNNKVG